MFAAWKAVSVISFTRSEYKDLFFRRESPVPCHKAHTLNIVVQDNVNIRNDELHKWSWHTYCRNAVYVVIAETSEFTNAKTFWNDRRHVMFFDIKML